MRILNNCNVFAVWGLVFSKTYDIITHVEVCVGRSMFVTMALAAQSASLARNDAIFSAMQNSQARMDLAMGASAISFGSGLNRDVFQREQALDMQGLQARVRYLYYCAMQEALEKRLEKEAKRTFSYFI